MFREREVTVSDIYAQTDAPLLDRGDLLGRLLTPQLVDAYYDRLHPDARGRILNVASEAIRKLSQNNLGSFTRELTWGLAKGDDYWSQDRRDLCLDLLDAVDMGRLKPTSLLKDYLDAVDSVAPESDVYGPVDSLLEVGIKLAPHFPAGPTCRGILEDTWGNAAIKFPAEDIEYIDEKVSKITEAISMDPDRIAAFVWSEPKPSRANKIKEAKIDNSDEVSGDARPTRHQLAFWAASEGILNPIAITRDFDFDRFGKLTRVELETLELLTDYGNVRNDVDIAKRRRVSPPVVKHTIEHIWDKLYDGIGRIDRVRIGMAYIAAKQKGILSPISE